MLSYLFFVLNFNVYYCDETRLTGQLLRETSRDCSEVSSRFQVSNIKIEIENRKKVVLIVGTSY